MNYKSMKAPQLIAEIQKLEEANNNLTLQAQNALNAANWFASVIEAVEKVLIAAPFLNKEGKFFKKLWWAITNFDKIISLIEEIAQAIKSWRQKIEDIKAQQALNGTSN